MLTDTGWSSGSSPLVHPIARTDAEGRDFGATHHIAAGEAA